MLKIFELNEKFEYSARVLLPLFEVGLRIAHRTKRGDLPVYFLPFERLDAVGKVSFRFGAAEIVAEAQIEDRRKFGRIFVKNFEKVARSGNFTPFFAPDNVLCDDIMHIIVKFDTRKVEIPRIFCVKQD